jgi:antitoxin component YwqK of YwqJK toxin-antitoxin module
MKVILTLFLFLPFFALSQLNQTDARGMRQGLWQKKQPNGRLIYEGQFKDNKPIGEWKRYHPEGQLKAVIIYRSDSDSADARLFDEWGKKVAEGIYLNQQKSGLWTYFSENRRISDEQMANGVKHGKSKKYYETGEVWEETDWINGVQEGNYEVFFKNGQPFFQCKMKNNLRNGLCLTYFQNGRVELEAHYKNGLHHGEWKYFKENGDYWYSLFYEDGEIMNPQIRDSIANLQLQNMELGKDTLSDPEKYMADPTEYMMKKRIF